MELFLSLLGVALIGWAILSFQTRRKNTNPTIDDAAETLVAEPTSETLAAAIAEVTVPPVDSTVTAMDSESSEIDVTTSSTPDGSPKKSTRKPRTASTKNKKKPTKLENT